MGEKTAWEGEIISIQPRIRLIRSFDERSHNYLGYVLQVRGRIADREEEFAIGIGKGAHAKHQFRVGDFIKGVSHPVGDARKEPVDYYMTSGLMIVDRGGASSSSYPPWLGVPPELEVYRERGHRRLDTRTYNSRCGRCIWGCRMPVEITIDQWAPQKKQYRFETFCYGPKSCSEYKAGAVRKVPGRRGMVWEEKDWVDEEATSHRGIDE